MIGLFRLAGLTALLFALLLSCTETTTTSSGMFGDDTTVTRRPIFQGRQPEQETVADRNALQRGTDQFVNPDAVISSSTRAEIRVVNDRDVEISLVNASIEAAAKAILGDVLGRRYVVSDQVTGRITIQTTGPIPKSALLELFEAALAANRAKLEVDGDVVSIVPGTSGNRTFRMAADGVGDGSVIVVAPLQFVSASQMVNLLEPLVEEGLTAVPDRNRNLLLMSGNRGQLEAAIDALNLFDVDVLQGKSVALVRLKAADPADVVEELTTIFEAQEGGMLDGVIEFLPNSRLSSVLVITSRSHYLAQAQRWIRELDRTASGNRRFTQIYPLQNRSAAEIAPILDDLLGDLGEGAGNGGADNGRSRVAADDSRNALVVRALAQEHDELARILVDLDSTPSQVLLEATIAEVALKNEVSLGVRWFFKSGNFNFTFSDVSSGGTGASFPGFSTAFSLPGAEAALNALAGVTDVKIISSPTVTVLNNEHAVLQIGDEVPIATQRTTNPSDPDAVVSTTIDYRNTGVILEVSPRIGAGGQVVLDIRQEVSDVTKTNTSGIDSPTIRQREIETSVVLRDGMTLALGGLVQEGNVVTETKVPGLGDVPLLGALFRTVSSEKTRSELLILIRPRVIETGGDAQQITDLLRAKLSASNSIIETGLGSPTHTIDELFQ